VIVNSRSRKWRASSHTTVTCLMTRRRIFVNGKPNNAGYLVGITAGQLPKFDSLQCLWGLREQFAKNHSDTCYKATRQLPLTSTFIEVTRTRHVKWLYTAQKIQGQYEAHRLQRCGKSMRYSGVSFDREVLTQVLPNGFAKGRNVAANMRIAHVTNTALKVTRGEEVVSSYLEDIRCSLTGAPNFLHQLKSAGG